MTGFGKGEVVCGDKKFRVELRSLNSKQLDLRQLPLTTCPDIDILVPCIIEVP